MFRYWIGVDPYEITLEDNNWHIPLNMHHGYKDKLDMNYGNAYLMVIF